MTASQAWRLIALAFFKRAAGKQSTLAQYGFCNAIDHLRDDTRQITEAVANAMIEDVDDVRYAAARAVSPSWPEREGHQGNRNGYFRGMLALLFAADHAASEKAIALALITPDAEILAAAAVAP